MIAAIAIVLGVTVVALLLYAATRPDTMQIQRSLEIQAPAERIRPLINDMQRFNTWNPYNQKDPTMKGTYRGPNAGPGAAYDFDGNKNVGKGSITINGQAMVMDTPAKAMGAGMAFLTEDRKDTGCFLCLDIQDNIEMAVLNQRYVNQAGFVQAGPLARDSAEMARRLRVKTPGMGEVIQNLSGGNQQKVLVGRWLLTNPRILILDEPTRGIDVGAKAEIHKLVSELASQGVAILMISSEMPEVLGMSDRVAVMHQGRITGILDRSEATQVSVMDLAAK